VTADAGFVGSRVSPGNEPALNSSLDALVNMLAAAGMRVELRVKKAA
jgi:predicted XRE-type DNA-binding protein